jgi:hypothetical protein
MPFLTIAGTTYLASEFSEEEPLYVGHEEEAFDGTLRSTISAVKRRWRGTLIEMTQAQHQTLFSAVAAGQHVAVAGDAMPASTTCRVKILGAPFQRERLGLTFTRHASILVMEV